MAESGRGHIILPRPREKMSRMSPKMALSRRVAHLRDSWRWGSFLCLSCYQPAFFFLRCGFYFHLVSGCCVSTDRLTLPPCVGGWVGEGGRVRMLRPNFVMLAAFL